MKQHVLFSLFIIVLSSYQHALSQKSIRFDSTGDYLEVPHSTSLAPSRLTIEFWLKVHGLGGPGMGGEQVILDKRLGTAGYYLGIYNTEFPLHVRATTLSSGTDVNAFVAIDAETWYHIALTHDTDDSLRLYLNGQIWSIHQSVQMGSYEPETTQNLRIGGYASYPEEGPHVLKGQIDELRIWTYARSQEAIASTMHAKLTGNESGLAAYWDFDSQTDLTVDDLSPNANDGIVHGNAQLVDSDAPVGFVPPPAPVGLRAYGGYGGIYLTWKPGVDSQVSFELHRGDSGVFALDSSTLIATLQVPASTYTDADATAGQNYYYWLRAVDQDGHYSVTESATMGRAYAAQDDYLTGVYYYPWYWSTDWQPIEETGWPGYHRHYLQTRQPPMLGEYSSRDQHVIRQHFEWMRSYGIDFIVLDWGEGFSADTIDDYMLPVLAGASVKFAIFHSANRFKDSATGLITFDDEVEEQMAGDFTVIADYFTHPNYFTIDGRPTVFLYNVSQWRGDYLPAISRIRSEMQARGYDLYLVGDEFYPAMHTEHMEMFDALSPYITLDDSGYPIDTDFFGDLSVRVGRAEDITSPFGLPFIPNVNPGSAGRHLDAMFDNFPRQSTAGAASTSTLEEYIRVMRPFVDPQLNMITVTSWNEWWEDTQIEPTIVAPVTTRDISDSGTYYTVGYSYEGYGFKALEAVRDLLAPGWILPSIDHFAYTAHTDGTYSISVSEAWSGGMSLETGDEIGVFDGDLCVGAVAVTGDWPLGFWAWVDDSETAAADGFASGNNMSFRIWDSSANREFLTVATLATGDGTFGDRAYAQVSLISQDEDIATAVGDLEVTGPTEFALHQNHPNPFNPSTHIQFDMPLATHVSLKIYNTLGQEVRDLIDSVVPAGHKEVVWDGNDNAGVRVSSGIYFVRFKASESTDLRRMTFIE
ncbi:LamG-like jellyroll fold domain-containing protein [Candidatus Latescibacterota bacterium]